MNTSKGTEFINEEGGVEIKVDSVDKPVKKEMKVTHVIDSESRDPASEYVNPGEALSSRVDSAKPVSSKQDN
ncbi:hypothetical protein L1987_23096 [Smallanthus sonchifolius]|uniref:Uncharacterized protein n=1 Tax=Smallanthus sonchifolius TaxID=185202 RepID=A0ACB9IGI0_9ASTR|nr:hypothetical protein L1987_23096 [Smallanthus sonchifolius]